MTVHFPQTLGSWQTAAKAEFDSWSRNYDQTILQQLIFGPSHKMLLELVHVPASGRVLDVGCGTGRFALRLLHRYPHARIVGLDLSDGMLGQAARNSSNLPKRLQLVRGDSQDLPFGDDSFDLVTCNHSFHHYPDQRGVVMEMYRVLKPGGQIAIVDGARDGWWGWFVFDGLVTAIERNVHHCSARRFGRLFHSAGFENLQQHYGGILAPFLVSRAVKAVKARRKIVAVRMAACCRSS